MRVRVNTEYRAGGSTEVELPEGKTWEDVKHHYVKWGVLYITFKDGHKIEQSLDDDVEIYDMKRPAEVTVYDEEDNELCSDW